jgi:NodT family efflux transporter outer membrane factor (OMF) lipoprotein
MILISSHPSHLRRFQGLMLCALGAIVLQGCTVGPRYKAPSFQAPPVFKESAPQQAPDGTTWEQAKPNDAALRGKWWEIYQEPELNSLEDKLNTDNQSIAQSFQNFMAARALVRQARSNYFPTVSIGTSYTRARSSGSEGSIQLNGQTLSSSELTPPNDFSFPIDVSWQPDVWGRVRNTVREYANAAQVSAADLANERLSVQANLAIYYFELRGQDAQIALYQQTIEVYKKSLTLTKTLNTTGVDNQQSVAQAELNLKSAESALTNLRIARAQYEHAIALLIGQPASSFSLASKSLTTAAPAVPAGLPSELLQRRPDIAAAERTMAQANALIGVQTAAFYPSFSITAEGGLQSSTIGNWFTWPSRFFSIGPSASETIFDAGSRRALLANYKAQYQADVAAYRQTVLTAFQQTEDYLAAQRLLAEQLKQQQAVIDAAQKYYDLALTRYRVGVDSYLDVSTAQTSLLTQQQTAVTLRTQQMTSNVQLIEALGGGWNQSQLPSERAVAHK